MAYIVAQTAKNGRRAGFYAMFGIWSGAFVHVVFSVIGLSAILATSATAFTIVKWIGAAYLIWLGIQALRSNGSSLNADTPTSKLSDLAIFRQGILVSVLNPKVAIFFLAFLPQFAVIGSGPESAQLLLHGMLIIFVAAFIEVPIVLIGSKLRNVINNSPSIGKWMDRTLGTLFIGLGVKLALSERG
uniref:Lysine exporter protein (LYSE/YGGA) n=1 Tax=Rheinheimera sp. BAL341 TaxID=1708203 RepID=A0A486XII5_9GAMM